MTDNHGKFWKDLVANIHYKDQRFKRMLIPPVLWAHFLKWDSYNDDGYYNYSQTSGLPCNGTFNFLFRVQVVVRMLIKRQDWKNSGQLQ